MDLLEFAKFFLIGGEIVVSKCLIWTAKNLEI
jgi:hypothetical protein